MAGPIFIVGVDRSGTTLLSMMLGMHSMVWIPYESHFHVAFHERYNADPRVGEVGFNRVILDEIRAQKYVRDWDITIPDGIDVRACSSLACILETFHTACAAAQGKVLWGDKTPRYIVHLDVINELFPAARFVHIVRDGRDVARSLVNMWWGPKDFASALEYWARRVELGSKMLGMLPKERRMLIRFEDLVRAPREELQRVTTFLGIPFEERMLSYHVEAAKQVGERIRQHHANLTRAPQPELTYKWKRALPPSDQALAWQLAGTMLEKFGYEPGVREHPLRLIKKIYYRGLRFIRSRFGA